MSNKKKILFVADVRGWSYADRAEKWSKLLSDEFEIDTIYLSEYKSVVFGHRLIKYIKDSQSKALSSQHICAKDLLNTRNEMLYKYPLGGAIFNHDDYDGIYFFYHRALCDSRLLATPIPLEKVAVGINNEKWEEKTAKVEFDTYLKGVRVITGCNSNIIDKFSGLGTKVMRVSQCVDESVFYKKRIPMYLFSNTKKFTIGWSGAKDNPIKNLPMVEKACNLAGVELNVASDLDRNSLNLWYNSVDAVVCASKSEGGPMMLLEAGAVGVPVISTPVGIAREIVEHEKTGLVVDWSAASMADAINKLKTSSSLRRSIASSLKKEVLKNWIYSSRINEIRMVLREISS